MNIPNHSKITDIPQHESYNPNEKTFTALRPDSRKIAIMTNAEIVNFVLITCLHGMYCLYAFISFKGRISKL